MVAVADGYEVTFDDTDSADHMLGAVTEEKETFRKMRLKTRSLSTNPIPFGKN